MPHRHRFPQATLRRGNTVLLDGADARHSVRARPGPDRPAASSRTSPIATRPRRSAARTSRSTPTTRSRCRRASSTGTRSSACEVNDATTHESLGQVTDILETGANDVYVVRGRRGEILVPAIKDVVKDDRPRARAACWSSRCQACCPASSDRAAQRLYRTPAVILKRMDLGEADRIVTLYLARRRQNSRGRQRRAAHHQPLGWPPRAIHAERRAVRRRPRAGRHLPSRHAGSVPCRFARTSS